MTYLQAMILGIVQGLTEFFPVSSSGHLELFQVFFGLQSHKNTILFDLVCHGGTLLALCAVSFYEIKKIVIEKKKFLLSIFIALIPLFPLLFILKEIKSLFFAPPILGFTFFTTSVLLFLSSKKEKENTESRSIKWQDPLFIGLFQALALLPGISRSGSTIAAARLIGWSFEEAIRFSFLLAIPTILGGIFVESVSLFKEEKVFTEAIHFEHYALGFFFSFMVGFFALKTMMRLGIKALFFFAWYCLMLALFCLVYFF